MRHDTREAWLIQAIEEFKPWFEARGSTYLVPTHVSIGFPFASRKAIGQCFNGEASDDGAPHIFISPIEDDPIKLLGTLAHELCHSVLAKGAKHGKKFSTLAEKIGLLPPWTATPVGPDLAAECARIALVLGELPHSKLNPTTLVKKQSTRMIKASCSDCGYTVRLARKWLEAAGPPDCPTHNTALETDAPEEEGG